MTVAQLLALLERTAYVPVLRLPMREDTPRGRHTACWHPDGTACCTECPRGTPWPCASA